MTPRLALTVVWIAVKLAAVLLLSDLGETLVIYQNY